ncbi:MAG: hypothetical protein QME27_03435 [Syntrophaceae bacterium]|nr:hypothetical protein [Syntrophaceae bacterium]
MKKIELFEDGLLQIELIENTNSITMVWTGKSTHRKPSEFISPILADAIRRSNASKKRIIMDFRRLEYMNSSTITPVIKILERAKRGATEITLLYNKSLKWQDLSFSALEIFETQDSKVEIKGVENHVPGNK